MTISNDLIYEILLRVPVKHLLRCRCVSKTWCSLIDSPEFVKIHMHENIHAVNKGGLIISEPGKLYLADYESLHDDVTNPIEIVDPVIKYLVCDANLVGSANGLVCFYTRGYNVILMNPSTRKCITMPREPYELRPTFCCNDFRVFTGGFGYDHVSDDYKFVKLGISDINPFGEIIVTVYSVRTNSWTHIQNARLSRDINLDGQWGRFAGGALYWKAIDYGKKTEIIVGFDLGLGQFREVARDRNSESLHDFGGNLYTLKYSKSRVDVFKMNEYNAENPWSKAFSIRGRASSVVIFVESGQPPEPIGISGAVETGYKLQKAKEQMQEKRR
ncbi:hypothetical protein ACET3Z_012925 [Daucus carota]